MQCNKCSVSIKNAKKLDTQCAEIVWHFNSCSDLIEGAPQWLIDRMHLNSIRGGTPRR